MPFADYTDFADCVAKNRDKDNPDAYCAAIKRKVEDGKEGFLCPQCGKPEGVAVFSVVSSHGQVIEDNGEQELYRTCLSCHHEWQEEEQMHHDFTRILKLFQKRFGEDMGREKFHHFVDINRLDVSKQYSPSTQFKESFQWVEPLITLYRQDTEAKYYKTIALNAIVSLNNNDYEDYDAMKYASKSMNYRPLNYNHDHSQWLSFPRTRADFAKADDLAVETILRIDNADLRLQKQMDHDPSIPENEWINHVSIEGRPEPWGGYHFTGLALLQKGYQLPGDPLTQIEPLFMNESIGAQVCKIMNGRIECQDATQGGDTITTKNGLEEAGWGDASWPDSCFAYLGLYHTTGNKSDRKLPYKNPDGTPDIPHVRNALARLDQTEGISAEEKARIRSMLENILKRENPDYTPPEKEEGDKNKMSRKLEDKISDDGNQTALDMIDKTLQDVIVKLEREGATKDTKIAEQASLITETMSRIHALDTETTEQKALLKTKENTIAELTKGAATFSEESTRTVEELKQQSTKSIEDLRHQSREQLQKLEDTFAVTKERLSKEISELGDKLKKSDIRCVDYQKDILDLRQERNDAVEEQHKADVRMDEARQEVKKTSEKFADMSSTINDLSKAKSTAESKMDQAIQDNRQLREDRDALKKKNDHIIVSTKKILKELYATKGIGLASTSGQLWDPDKPETWEE